MREKRKRSVALKPFMTEAAQMLYICPSLVSCFENQQQFSDSPVTKGVFSLPEAFHCLGVWFVPHFLTSPEEWISELIRVKTPSKTETRLFLTYSLIRFTTLLHRQHSWGCGVKGNGLVWGSWEAGNLSDNAVIKAHVSWYSACHEAAAKIWNPHCESIAISFVMGCWDRWLLHSSHHRWHTHALVVLQSLEVPLWTVIAGVAQVCLNT